MEEGRRRGGGGTGWRWAARSVTLPGPGPEVGLKVGLGVGEPRRCAGNPGAIFGDLGVSDTGGSATVPKEGVAGWW